MKVRQYIVKVASLCNLNCSYCYVYNKGDTTWQTQPKQMSVATFEQLLIRISEHCEATNQDRIQITFHGGEPLLIGPKKFQHFCVLAKNRLHNRSFGIDVQTNGTLIDSTWARIFRDFSISVGISIDGPQAVHDQNRRDHRGQGSYSRLLAGLQSLKDEHVPFNFLTVIPLGEDPISVHSHLVNLGCSSIGYLFPAETHESIGQIHDTFGPTPCADFLIPIFDYWWETSTVDFKIRELWNMARIILGGTTQLDTIGNPPIDFLAIQPDGLIEGLDRLRACSSGFASLNRNVWKHSIGEVFSEDSFHATAMNKPTTPTACMDCEELLTCGGGYLSDRFSRQRGFDNPSVWCEDIKRILAHIRGALGVSTSDTHSRRALLYG